jgi:hypothetical protein
MSSLLLCLWCVRSSPLLSSPLISRSRRGISTNRHGARPDGKGTLPADAWDEANFLTSRWNSSTCRTYGTFLGDRKVETKVCAVANVARNLATSSSNFVISSSTMSPLRAGWCVAAGGACWCMEKRAFKSTGTLAPASGTGKSVLSERFRANPIPGVCLGPLDIRKPFSGRSPLLPALPVDGARSLPAPRPPLSEVGAGPDVSGRGGSRNHPSACRE